MISYVNRSLAVVLGSCILVLRHSSILYMVGHFCWSHPSATLNADVRNFLLQSSVAEQLQLSLSRHAAELPQDYRKVLQAKAVLSHFDGDRGP